MDVWKEYYVYSAEWLPLAAGTGSSYTDVEVRIDTDAAFEFVKTMFQPITSRFRVRYRDDSIGKMLMKGEQDIRTIGGTTIFSMAPGGPTAPGFLPFLWPKPYLISGATTLTVSAADFSGLAVNTRLSFHGSKVRSGKAPWERKWARIEPYIYSISSSNTLTLAANGTASASIATDSDAPFLVHKIVGARTGPALVTIKDGARDRQWMNIAVHFDNLVGNGHFPNVLPSPRWIEKKAVIAVTIQDLSGAANTIELNFVGVKLHEK